ncbi:hypothetical protein QBC41DRAFT_351365 [Cercophora samala]|uniref:G domain-containing protein n=1 Tax=Cercophora samala TaxID=330535 RepID=A0AA39YTX1_9PEZI|nr:hypothetical protein QBC41DRAFT_351365 [Cercophora samala]
MANPLERSSLGHVASIGTLYDARNDGFISVSIDRGQLQQHAVVSCPSPRTEVHLNFDEPYKTRFLAAGIKSELAASVLSQLVRLKGSAVHLSDDIESDSLCVQQATLYYNVSTVQEKLNVLIPGVKDCFDLGPLQQQRNATHVVTGIEWGLRTVVTSKRYLDRAQSRDVDAAFRQDMESLKVAVERLHSPAKFPLARTELSHEVIAFSDSLQDEGLVMQDLMEAYSFIELVPAHIRQHDNAKGWPISYTLMPLDALFTLLDFQVSIKTPLVPISLEGLGAFVELFDKYHSSARRLARYYSFLVSQRLYVADAHVTAVSNAIRQLKTSKQSTEDQYGCLLARVRGGQAPASSLRELHRNASETLSAIEALADQERETIDFVAMAVKMGAKYIGHNSLDLLATEASRRTSGCYIFFFNTAAMKSGQPWHDNHALFQELLRQSDPQQPVYLVDCDVVHPVRPLVASRICQYQSGKEVSSDLLATRQYMAQKCFARFTETAREDTSMPRPVKRRFVKMPCPSPRCSPSKCCDWVCPACLAPIEFGYSDEYIYCDCGRSLYSDYEFRCNAKTHGAGFEACEPTKLLACLKNLDPSGYLNILILGETGVGKSTFINGFVNYLQYTTLDEAKAAEGFDYVIPCSFSMQMMDRTKPDHDIIEKIICVGSRDDERDGSTGDSATQQTMVYPVTIGNQTYRLIDTPGIGDTRGLSYDKKNMSDILKTLSSYDELHGILILLKSNNSRLTVTFNFCIKELLVHLHRNAAANIVFGFTNTRISNYTPGDTFAPLKRLLAEHSEFGLRLSTPTTYCFDSESFRFLAAYKNGVPMKNEQDFRRSWQHSRDEALRMIEHFRKKQPHNVNSTISLNGARGLIMELTKPMARISQVIRATITKCEESERELKDTRLTGDNLRKKLKLQKKQFNPVQLTKPRTVCTQAACCDFKDSGKGDGEVVTIYRTHCHAECYLENVKEDVLADPGLIRCLAFNGTNACISCHHHWQQHLHVMYELEEVTVTVTDTEIERQLQANDSDVTLRQVGIQRCGQLIAEYKGEQREIQKAAVRFGLFLKQNAMAPINDATLDYIDMLIKDEEAKIAAGRAEGISVDGNVKRLSALEEDKRCHIELAEALTANMKMKSPNKQGASNAMLDEKGVADLVERLYRLKHYGENLRSVKNTITQAHEATYRERPFRVQDGGSSRSWTTSLYDTFSQVLPASLTTKHRPNKEKRSRDGPHRGAGGGGRGWRKGRR